MREIKGFIFDLDGVITDTARYHYLAWKKLSDELGLAFSERDNERLKGVERIQSFEIILEINNASDKYGEEDKNRLADQKNEYYKQLVETITPDDILEGVPQFIKEARAAGIRCAVASVSRNASRVLELLGISNQFDFIAEAAAIRNPKPHPEIFLTCAAQLRLKPCECIGFEDAQAGIESIHAAGMFSVGINVFVTSKEPDLKLSSTKELNLETVLLSARGRYS
jgi:beta-phosphoglucomutase